MRNALMNLSSDELCSFVIMERIVPPVQNATLIRLGEVLKVSAVCELGIYSVYLGSETDSESPILNTYAGHLLRVKSFGVDEGGVATGYSVLSAPLV